MALKIVYKICCGIDVHKTFVVACIASTNKQGITTYKSYRFSTYTKGLKELLQWLLESNCKDVCMESTGKYWIPVYNVLEKDCSIILAHPKYVKAIRGKKTDKKDAKWIADLFKHDLVAGSFMPPADIRKLRDLMRYRYKLTCFMSSEKNRLQNCLTVSNIQLANVVSDTFGKSSKRILDKILELELATPYQQKLDLILTAPSFKNIFSAITVISEIGVNMESFPSAKHLCSWAGLAPTNNESAGKKKSVRISKAGCYIKPLLVQCANSVVMSKKHPEIRNRYLRLKKRRGHKKAIIAIARMLLTALYNMLKKNEPYNAELYRKSDVLPANREISIEQAVLMARLQGYKIKSATE